MNSGESRANGKGKTTFAPSGLLRDALLRIVSSKRRFPLSLGTECPAAEPRIDFVVSPYDGADVVKTTVLLGSLSLTRYNVRLDTTKEALFGSNFLWH